jgi:DNA-binding IscR family transcriptional regulator
MAEPRVGANGGDDWALVRLYEAAGGEIRSAVSVRDLASSLAVPDDEAVAICGRLVDARLAAWHTRGAGAGSVGLTSEGVLRAERFVPAPYSRQQRESFLRALWELAKGHSARVARLNDVARSLGLEADAAVRLCDRLATVERYVEWAIPGFDGRVRVTERGLQHLGVA